MIVNSYLLLEGDFSGFLLLEGDFSGKLIIASEDINNAPNGNRRQEYQPTYHELRERREIERKFEEAKLDLKSTEIKIEDLEFKRLSDLADRAMQLELLQLLAQQNDLMLLIEELQQQKLMALNDDSDFLMLLMALPFNA